MATARQADARTPDTLTVRLVAPYRWWHTGHRVALPYGLAMTLVQLHKAVIE